MEVSVPTEVSDYPISSVCVYHVCKSTSSSTVHEFSGAICLIYHVVAGAIHTFILTSYLS